MMRKFHEVMMRFQSPHGCRRITFEIVIRPVRTEGGHRYGRYWTIEVLNHLRMIESSVAFFSSEEIGTNGYEFSLMKVLASWDSGSFYVFIFTFVCFYFMFHISCGNCYMIHC